MHAELDVIAKRISNFEGADGYTLAMWRLTLAEIHKRPEDISASDNCDAIPYVPGPVLDLLPMPGALDAVLDVGCLGGYGLFDFAVRWERKECEVPALQGIDVDDDSVRLACELAPLWGKAQFQKASAEDLPFADKRFRLVIARLVLPYVGMQRAVTEMARVCVPDGIVFIQYHGFSYYWRRLWNNRRSLRSMVYYARPMVSGLLYRVLDYQFQSKWLAETALCRRTMRRLLARHGLKVVWEGGFRAKPMVAARKREGGELTARFA